MGEIPDLTVDEPALWIPLCTTAGVGIGYMVLRVIFDTEPDAFTVLATMALAWSWRERELSRDPAIRQLLAKDR